MYSYVSLAKGFGILLVIAGHFTTVKYAPGFYNAFRDWIYAFHMPLFMSLSGFLFAYSLKRSSGQLPFWNTPKLEYLNTEAVIDFTGLEDKTILFAMGYDVFKQIG